MGNAGNKTDKTAKVSFFTGVKAEFRKIIWPARKTLGKQAVAVVSVSIVLGLIITLIDTVLQYGINFLVK
ncbi:preprotein translocase subunit SecE [bacterium C-53]|nr:preprotein translocase subunit SecE [Lachnospiraceae bacterium]NBI02873.1 preprotein translocase subunit SecE [Lachnospiraceae bacterium]RKJ10998.1 preprotein translocase subunit SecE [bacterium C-53]